MAIENERKYILFPANDVMFMTDLECMDGATVHNIQQGYLPGGPRIRRVKNKYDHDIYDYNGNIVKEVAAEYKFTYKIRIGADLVEIETDIARADYEKLTQAAKGGIRKTRVTIPEGDLKWEVDFFHDEENANLYLVMAEVELPEGVDAPETVPQYITDNLLHLVGREDRRFDNSNLSDPYAVRANVDYIRKEREMMIQDLEYFTNKEKNDVDQSA
jgi:CYTH domain-containing protein